jgi:hypothetical protein
MKALFAGMIVLCCASAAAQAETFTFTNENKNTARVAVPMPPPATPAVGAMSTAEGTVTYADGKTEKVTGTCSTQTRPPGDQFSLTGVCENTNEAGDKTGVTFGCSIVDAEKRTSNCWGILIGLSGKYQGRSGTLTWTAVGNEDQSGAKGAGGGSWRE